MCHLLSTLRSLAHSHSIAVVVSAALHSSLYLSLFSARFCSSLAAVHQQCSEGGGW